MRDEKKRHEHRWNEIRRSLESWSDADAQAICLIKRVEQIDASDDVEHPHDDGPRPTGKSWNCKQRENGRREIAIGGRARETVGQVRRDHTRHEKRQTHESKGVQEEQRSKGLGIWSLPEH